MQYSTEKTSKTIALILVTMMIVSISALTVTKPIANAQTARSQTDDSFSGSYYSWPIDAQNTAWQNETLAAQFDGPSSAHVRWKFPFALGGVAGFEDLDGKGEHGFDMGDAYAGKWTGGSIVGGIAYSTFDSPNLSPTVTVAVDVRTGEELWRSSVLGGSPFAQTIMTDWGLKSYIWRSVTGAEAGGTDFGTVYSAYDPYTCLWVYNMTNMPSGTRTTGYNGQFILYSLSLTGGYITYWDQIWLLKQSGVIATLNRDRVINASKYGLFNWSTPVNIGTAREYRLGDRIIGSFEDTASATSLNRTVMWAISLKPGEEGKLLYNVSATYNVGGPIAEPASLQPNTEFPSGSVGTRLFGDTPYDSVHLHWNANLMYYRAYSFADGHLVWESKDFNFTGGFHGAGGEAWQNHYTGTSGTITRQLNYISNTSRYDVLVHCGVGGWVYGYNATGTSWAYFVEDPYNEMVFANGWWESDCANIAGKVYFTQYEHSPDNPFPRGGPMVCLNITTGEEIYRINGMYRSSGWGGQPILGSGVIMTQDTYNQETWCIGNGPSSTTVTVPDAVVSNGGTATIRGTVMDISPATSGVQVKLRFPQGVPAVSEQSMSNWMLYVYKQFNRPTDTVGVPVTLTVYDSKGQVYDTATVTSDIYGQFDYQFAAKDAGAYTVKASFAGSNSYYGSFAVSSSFTVAEAPESIPEPQAEPVSNVDTYFMPSIVGIIVALIVVAAILVLLLLKRSSKV